MDQQNNNLSRPALAKTISGHNAMRVIRGPGGGMLVAYEAGQDSARVLVFEWAGNKTEIPNHPADWRKLKDEELYKLYRSAATK